MQKIIDGARFRGLFIVEIYDKLGGKLISDNKFHNVVTDEGLNHILNVVYHGTTPVSPWYCLLFESDTTPDADTTYATPVFTECTAYYEATRPEYNEAAASGQSITNSANKATFTASATKTLYGAALVSYATKGDTAQAGAILICAGKFGTAQPVIDGNVVTLTYTNSAADDGV